MLRAFTELRRGYIFISVLAALGVIILVVYLIRKLQFLVLYYGLYGIDDNKELGHTIVPDDIQMIMAGKRWSKITPEDYILAVIVLYLDTMLIFFYLSQILSDCNCDKWAKTREFVAH